MNPRRILDASLGVYVALVAVTAGALAGWDAGAAELPVAAFVAAGLIVGATVAAGARSVDDLAERVRSLPVAAGIVGLPLAYGPYMLLAIEPDSAAGVVALVGLLAVNPGFVIIGVGSYIRTRRTRETATELVVVTVGDADTDQRTLRIAAVIVVGFALLAAGGATIVTGEISTTTLTTFVGGLLPAVFLFATSGRELAVTDAGVRIQQSIIDWEDLAGYRLTDEKLLLVRSEWYLPTRRFDRGEVDDEAVVEALGEFIPRLDEQGRVEASARR